MKPTKNIYDMNKEEIYTFIEKQIPIKTLEKNKYGEVFTSPILINKMLDLFPPRVWTAYNMKWLDPSVGSGFFMIFVYLRLMEGLKSWQTNKHKRSQHIIQNMLYMVELNKTNCKICKSLFGSNVNIFCGDFLVNIKFNNNDNDNIKETDVRFDCIIGNPPFQNYYGLTKDGKRVSGGKSKLYERIFLKSYSLLKNGGYLSFVVPDNIFAGNGSETYKTLIQNNIPFVSFNPLNQDYFGKIQQPVCYFILHKGETPGLTNIEHSDKLIFKLKLQNRPVNPIRDWTLHTEQLINKYVSNERNNVTYNRGKSVASYKGNKYPIIFTPSKILQTNNSELAVGLGIKKAIIFSISPDFSFKMDYSGEYGSGPNTFFIPFETNKQGKMLETFLKSKDYLTLALATKTSRQFLKIAFIEHLKLTKIMKTNKTRKHKKTKHKKNKKQKTLKNK